MVTFVIAEEKPTATQKLRVRDFPAGIRAKAAEVRANYWIVLYSVGRSSVVVVPRVGAAESSVLVVVVDAAMEGVGAALGFQLHLASRAAVEVSGLIRRGDLELLNAGNRNGN